MSVWILLIGLGCGSGGVVADLPSKFEGEAMLGSHVEVDVAGLGEAISRGVTVVDVRTTGEFSMGHVPDAINQPLGSWTPQDPFFASLDRSEPVYLICKSGGRSAAAADQLAAAGFQAVNVLGGTSAWIASGREVTH